METEYLKMTLTQRLAYRAARAWFKPFHRRPGTASRPTQLAHLEEGHGLRVLDCTPSLTHQGWYVDQHQSETTKPALILLPHGRALPAATDPWNKDAYTLFRGEVMEFPGEDAVRRASYYGKGWENMERAHRDAINRADRCAELLAEDYRDDNEHQQKLYDLEEAREAIKRAEEEHAEHLTTLRARVDERAQNVAELQEEAQAENVANYPRTLARVQRALEEARKDHAQAQEHLTNAEQHTPAEEEREAARQLEQETATPPRFNYFQN